MLFVAAQLGNVKDFLNFDAAGNPPADFPDAVDDNPPLLVAAGALPQASRRLDARVLNAGDDHGPMRPSTQHSQATGPATRGASMMSSTPPRPRSQVLLSFRSISRLSSDSARSPIMPASASNVP